MLSLMEPGADPANDRRVRREVWTLAVQTPNLPMVAPPAEAGPKAGICSIVTHDLEMA